MLRRVLVWIPVAAAAVWTLVRVAGIEAGFPLVPLMAFTPYAAALSVVPVLIALLARHRAATVAALVVAAVLAVNVLPRTMAEARADAAGGGAVLTVMTANLYFGHADAATVVGHVRDRQVDVLSVQELTPDAVEALDAAGLRDLLPHAILEPKRGASGGGLYARYPLEDLPDLAPASRMPQPAAGMTVPGGPQVELIAVHPAAPMPGNITDWSDDLDALPDARTTGPLRVLAGDFNATADHARFRRLLRGGYADAADAAGIGLAATWPTTANWGPLPGVMIDHVLADPRADIQSAAVLDLPGSDHSAVVATLGLPANV